MSTGDPFLDLFLVRLFGTSIGLGLRYPLDAMFMGAGMPWLSSVLWPNVAHFLRWFWVWT